MSYPPYGSGPQGNPPRPNNPYQNGPFPPQQPQRPQPPQQPRPGGPGPAPGPGPGPYGGNPYGGGGRPPQQPPNPYNQGPASPPPPPPPYGGQPPYGGGPGGPGGQPPFGGGPGGPGGQPPFGGGPGGPGNSGGGSRGSKKGVLIGIGVALALVIVGTVAVAASGHGGGGGGGGTPVAGASSSGGPITTTSNGGTSWSPPSWATKANDIGAADPNTVVQGTVWIAKQHPQDLATYAAEVGMPGTPDYHKYLTPAQFNSTFVNVPDAASAVTQWLQQDGMTIVSQGADSVVVSTTLAKVESVLKVQIDKYKHDGRVDIAPTGQPQFPSDVGNYVSSVTGLTTSSPVYSDAVEAPVPSPKNAPKKGKPVSAGAGKYAPAGGGIDTSWCSTYWGQKHANDAPNGPGGESLPMRLCGYTAGQIRHAYGVAQSGLTGKGVTVAIVDAYASPTIVQDVANWNQQMGLPQFAPGQFTQVMPQGGFPSGTDPKDVAGWQGEETMDIESVHLMAPDAKIVFYGTDGSDQGFDTALETIVANHTANIVSCSWGGPESENAQEEFQAKTQIFEQGAVEGIGFNFSSADNGDYTVAATNASDPNNILSRPGVAFPASDPFATGVGGTSLGIDANGNYSWESGWGNWMQQQSGNGWAAGNVFDGGAGGGNSSVFPQPSYQKGVVPDSLAATATGSADREVPDVSMVADWWTGLLIGITENGTINVNPGSNGGATFSESGGSYGNEEYGGTSLAAPLFSGVEALAQQAAGGVPVGFVNPILYKLVGTSALHDVSGAPSALGHEPAMETWNQSHNGVMVGMDYDTSLKTGPGYDDVTGVGSITGAFLTWFRDHPNGQ
ncbi:S53 family peptidase [Streptacidiphilus fuscans]|uniref:S8/S53 family peptidase n=1 Tax=Streptacidiphilus fuscans TaxID=2789292 RepID=A0A931FFW4_9ACTN|nr:S53 family peptidase [Streptacidiphilus fuscans]MBF9072033.1 S8/S53 family peptidase [Streptacidiphilus fuscans]